MAYNNHQKLGASQSDIDPSLVCYEAKPFFVVCPDSGDDNDIPFLSLEGIDSIYHYVLLEIRYFLGPITL